MLDAFPDIAQTPAGQAIVAGDAAMLAQVLREDPGARTAFARAQKPHDQVLWLPLHLAAWAGWSQGVKHLLAAGSQADCRSRATSPFAGRDTALHLAAEKGHGLVCNQLLAAGADLEARDAQGRTPLAVAVAFGQQAMCEQLLNAQADVEAQDLQGRSVLHLALCGQDSPELALQLLAYGVNPVVLCLREPKGFTVLHRAVAAGADFLPFGEALMAHASGRQLLKNKDPQFGRTPLALARYLDDTQWTAFLEELD